MGNCIAVGGTDVCVNALALGTQCTVDADCDRPFCGTGPVTGTICTVDSDCDRSSCDTGSVIGTICTVASDCDRSVCDTGSSIGLICGQNSDCDNPGTSGPPFCPPPGNENITGELFLALSGNINGLCDTYNLPGDLTLLTLAFNATTATTDPQGTPLILVSGSAPSGDCAILRNLVDLGIPCFDGNARITASR
jgi:hypothetical protein